MSPIIIGHRGASGYAPENTFSAFQLAQDLGGHGIEFDVQLTKDGIPLVIHDETLDRTTNLHGQVSTFTWEEIQKADAGSWMGEKWSGERVPRLADVLEACSHLFLNIELKNSIVPYPGMEEIVIELLKRYCDLSRVIVSSFNPQSVLRLKQLEPQLRTGLLYEEEPNDVLKYARHLGVMAVHPDCRLLTEEKVRLFQGEGLQVNTWTVNEPEEMKKMVRMGVDGIITNYPDRLRELLNQRT
jgi:glycerophosphoryl diester phosphodiesterase